MTDEATTTRAYVDSKNRINGQWVDAQDGDTLVVENPRHGKPLGTTPASKAVDVDAAVAAAKAAFPGWRATPLKERVQVLYRMKNLMEKHLEELTWLLSHENGKTMRPKRVFLKESSAWRWVFPTWSLAAPM